MRENVGGKWTLYAQKVDTLCVDNFPQTQLIHRGCGQKSVVRSEGISAAPRGISGLPAPRAEGS